MQGFVQVVSVSDQGISQDAAVGFGCGRAAALCLHAP